MYANHPEIAKRWDKEGKNYVKGRKSKNYDDRAIEMAAKMKGMK